MTIINIRTILVLLFMMAPAPIFADGVYAGVSLGAESNQIGKSGQLEQLDPSDYKPLPNSKKTVSGVDSAAGVAADLNVGYRLSLSQRFLFSVEADALTGFAQSEQHYLNVNKTNTATEALRFAVGASVLPALRIGRLSDVFLRAGVGVGQFNFAADGFMYDLANSRKTVQDAMYGVFGLGVDVHYLKHWNFRLEGDYYKFSNFEVIEDRVDGTPTPPPGKQQWIYNYQADYSPSIMRVAVGMSYDF